MKSHAISQKRDSGFAKLTHSGFAKSRTILHSIADSRVLHLGARASRRPWPSDWDDTRYLNIIDNLCGLKIPINIRIGVGGEFFISKTLVEGARRLGKSDNVRHLNLITNLSFHPKQYDRILAQIPREKVALVASFHPTEVKDIERWIVAAKELSTYFDLTTMSFAYPPILPRLPEVKARFIAEGLEHFVQPFIGVFGGQVYPQSYSDEERRIIREIIYSRHDYEFLLNLKRPGLCNAGFKLLFVNPFEQVTPCGGANHWKVLGDLSISPEISLLDGPRPCPTQRCQCDTENINTVLFENHYSLKDKNQHRFTYRFEHEAKSHPWMDEWAIPY